MCQREPWNTVSTRTSCPPIRESNHIRLSAARSRSCIKKGGDGQYAARQSRLLNDLSFGMLKQGPEKGNHQNQDLLVLSTPSLVLHQFPSQQTSTPLRTLSVL